MRKFILRLYFALLAITSFAQSISVTSFKMLPNDLTANTNGTEVLDQNGDKAALIKIITTAQGFSYDVGSLGIVKQEQKVGEIWLYVPHGVKHLRMNHQQFGLLNYTFNIPIEAAKTYEMQLAIGEVKPIVTNDDGKTYFVLSVTPKNAAVLIDNVLQPLDEDGSLVLRLNRGEHTYSVQAPGHIAENGVFVLGVEKQNKIIALNSTMAELTVSCETEGVDIFINETKKGNGKWTGDLMPGDYLVEVRKEGYSSGHQSITLSDCEKRTLLLPALIARLGTLDVNYKPIGCEVKIDGKIVGTSPDVFNSILAGKHTVELYKEGYSAFRKNVIIEEGQICTITGILTKEERNAETDRVYDVVEQMPSFPGGTSSLMAYLARTIKYPAVAEKNGIQGRVICTFIVDKDGSVCDVRVAKSVDPSLDKEAQRVISLMPKWIPGKQNGQVVRTKYTLPVTFRLQ